MPCPFKTCPIPPIPPRLSAILVAMAAALALAGAFTAQYGFGLRPCELCLIQRVPFAVIIILGGMALTFPRFHKLCIGASGLAFLINAGIALYHSGVERKWWAGLSGCSTPDMSGSINDILERIQQTAVVRCDEIPWDFLGLSMANYNIAFCLGMFLFCLIVLKKRTEQI